MALCRCKDHKPKGSKNNYVDSREPLGYPNTSSICGRKTCDKPGLIWLTKNEIQSENEIISFASSVSKVRIKKNSQ